MDRYAAFTAMLMIITIVLVPITTSSAILEPTSVAPNPANRSTFFDLVDLAGYIAEEHDVVTEDGYILYMHRIPGGPKSPVAPGKPPVLLIHGFLGCSDSWVLQGPKYDFAYLLVDSGYDVWLTNARGNYYGRRHKFITVDEPKFWEFSWHEVGIYDVAASIDTILSITGRPKVSIVAFSLGSTTTYALLSSRPEYNEKVHVSAMFGSVALFTHDLPGVIMSASLQFGAAIESFFRIMRQFEIFPREETGFSIDYLCRSFWLKSFCGKMGIFFFGVTHANGFGELIMPNGTSHHTQGTSLQNLMHLRQIILNKNFTRFDYGLTRNNELYGNSTTPPAYPLEKITAPVVLYCGLADGYSTKQDADVLRAKLPNAITIVIADPDFGHSDFMISPTAKSLLYDNVIQLFARYSGVKMVE